MKYIRKQIIRIKHYTQTFGIEKYKNIHLETNKQTSKNIENFELKELSLFREL